MRRQQGDLILVAALVEGFEVAGLEQQQITRYNLGLPAAKPWGFSGFSFAVKGNP